MTMHPGNGEYHPIHDKYAQEHVAVFMYTLQLSVLQDMIKIPRDILNISFGMVSIPQDITFIFGHHKCLAVPGTRILLHGKSPTISHSMI
jgi:hypothetical protein